MATRQIDSRGTERVRMEDIAKRLGVSMCTVSLALQNSPRISSKTSSRVHRMAAEMNYTPNHHARSLRTKTSHRIGVVIPELENPVYSEHLRAIHTTADENGYTLDFSCTQWNPDKEARVVQDLVSRQADGLILLIPASQNLIGHLREFAASGRPVCVLGPMPEEVPGVSTILSDVRQPMIHAVDYLLSLGHRRFGLLGIDTSMQDPFYHRRRMEGIRQALHTAGLGEEALMQISTNGEIMEHGFEAVKIHHEQGKEFPSAIISLNDSLAIGAIAGLKQIGLDVPRDISIIGFDNIAAASYSLPALTTLDLKPSELGQQAIALLFEMINEENMPARHILQVPELVVRQSTTIARERTPQTVTP